MNIFNAVSPTPLTAPTLWSAATADVPGWPVVEPLWQPVTEEAAIVTAPIAPHTLGRVKFQGTRWRAYSDRPLPLAVGTSVRVIGRHRGNILIVQPLSAAVAS